MASVKIRTIKVKHRTATAGKTKNIKNPTAYVFVSVFNKKQRRGEVFFEQVNSDQVKITAHFKGLAPRKKFGFHIHEFGDCRNKALNAGGHFNPANHPHGGPQDQKRHLGDLGNLQSDNKGHSFYSATITGYVHQLFGRSVVVHASEDDFKSQPSGNAGPRIACGIIGRSQPEKQTSEK